MAKPVELTDTIRRKLVKEGRLPETLGVPVGSTLRLRRRVGVEGKRREDFAGTLAAQATMRGLPEPVREHRFHPVRGWRFDLAYPGALVAVEVDGGAFAGGRHTSGPGFREDCVKLSEAAALGWRVLRVMPEHVTSGEAVEWLRRALTV